MSYLQLLHAFGNETKNKLRKLESIQLKIINCKWSCVFNNTCIKENILRNYVNLKRSCLH